MRRFAGFGPAKFEQLEARIHLNTVTWPYSRQTVQWTTSGVLQSHLPVRALSVQVGERAADKIVFSMTELTMRVSGGGPTRFDFKQTRNPAVHCTRPVRLRFGVDQVHRWLNAYLLWSPGPIRAFDGKLVSRALRALSIPATGSVPASINPI